MARTHLRWGPGPSPVIPGQPPAAPGWVTSIAFDGGAVVSWDTSQGGGPVTSWVVTPYIAGVAQAATSGTTANGRATVAGLTNSTAYTFSVQVSNQAGTALSPVSGANTPLVNLIFGDDFNGTVLDPSWVAVYRDGDQSAPETQFFLPGQIALDGAGHVLLTAGPGPVSALTYLDANPPFYRGGALVSRAYAGASLEWAWPGALATGSGSAQAVSQFSQPGFNFTYGKIQVNAKIADESGGWPALWMLGSQCQQTTQYDPNNVGTCNWPSAGSEEIDIAEWTGGGAGSSYTWTGNFNAGATAGPTSTPVTNPSTTFNTYEVDWASGTISWFTNGVAVSGTQPYSNAAVPSAPMFLLLNNAIRGTSTFTQPVLSVDWVRVFHN